MNHQADEQNGLRLEKGLAKTLFNGRMWSQIRKKQLKLDQNPSTWFHCVGKGLSRHLTKEGRQLARVLLRKCLNYVSWEYDKMPHRIHLKEFGLTFVHSFRGLSTPWWGVMAGQTSLSRGGPRGREMWAAGAHLTSYSMRQWYPHAGETSHQSPMWL